ncbi:MAG: 2,3-bisphosphoglycerate-independent phosphoglycerate mutase [Lachnospiraceae bacterium]|nr:2,3-bisphosphoglycerate-independent phosphoglycerate mutase [Lachnospiraceae bacterium]
MNKKILLVVMDGIGFSKTGIGDAVSVANTPVLDKLLKECPNTRLKAHGTAVGLPSDDDMGNSEVGHNALGCGQIYSQGAKLVNESLESGKMYTSQAWNEVIDNCKINHSTLHFIGLLSDGNVHSNISHLIQMLQKAKESGVKTVRIHVLLDGRDVPATSAHIYIEQLEKVLSELNNADFDAQIASGGGRMKITMDRYEADWNMVKLGWETHVLGKGRTFATASEAIETYRDELGVIDQDLPAFVIAKDGEPVGSIVDKDSVILFNFRGDRALELSQAFDYEEFDHFDRVRRPDVVYAGMLQYDGDLNLPKRYLVNPPEIHDTLSELLVANKLNQYAVSETQKFGHVTYFWNGNKSEKFSEELETFKEIPSDKVSFDERPWMKSAEITDDLIEAIKSEKYDFIRCNFPNGDMVGHTGNMDAVITSVEAVDLALSRLLKVADEYGVTVLITADHGNADEMFEKNKKGELQVRTAHSLNQVPFIIYDKNTSYTIKDGEYGLANVAPTVAAIFGLEAPKSWEDSMI